MKFKANVEDGIAISDIVQAATNPRDWSELGRRLAVYFKAHFSDDHEEWLRFLSGLRVIPAKKDRREVQKHAGRWCRVTSKEWHMVVDLGSAFIRGEGLGPDCILFVPQETVEKLIVLEEI